MSFKILCVIYFVSVGFVNAQSVIWRQIIGERFNEIAYNCIQVRDGGYVAVGFKEIIPPGTMSLISKTYIIKFDPYGNIIWQKILGDSSTASTAFTIIEDPDGNLYLPNYLGYPRLLKLNSNGNVLWDKSYQSYDILSFVGISFVDNYKNLVLLGRNFLNGYFPASVTKLDSSGNMIWNKSYYDSLSDHGLYYLGSFNCFWFGDMKYYICGFYSPMSGVQNRIGLIAKIDTSGNLIWQKKYTQCRGIYSMEQNSGNSFIACGDGGSSLYCQKFDSSGNIVWNQNYLNDTLAKWIGYSRIIKNYFNQFVLGTTSSFGLGRLMIIDSLGNIVLSKFYSYPNSYYIHQFNINNTLDSGYIVSGSLDSNLNFSNEKKADSQSFQQQGGKQIDFLIFKIDKFGNTVSVRSNNTTKIYDFDITISPNPYNSSFKLKLNLNMNSDLQVNLFDVSGRKLKTIRQGYFYQGHYEWLVNTPELSSGIYFVSIQANNKNYTKKVLLIK